MDVLSLLENFNPSDVLRKKVADITPLLQRFRSLVPDLSTAMDEFRALPISYKLSAFENIDRIDPVDFWIDVYNNTNSAGNGRFKEISSFALSLFSMPFSNACVERVFSIMNFVKSKLRNRLICETVEAALTVRYGLKFLGISAASFEPTKEMLRAFTSDMYNGDDDVTALEDGNDMADALALLDE